MNDAEKNEQEIADERTSLAKGIAVAADVMAAVAVLAVFPALGGWLDHHWGTTPACVLGGLALGAVACTFQLLKLVQGLQKDEQKKGK